MTTTTKRFRALYTSYTCGKCGATIAKGEYGWRARAGSPVYCQSCHVKSEPAADQATPAEPRPRRQSAPKRPRKQAPPDPTKGGGAMPGENCATRSADGVWRYEFNSVSEAVRDALDDYAQNNSTQEFLRKRMEYALSGRDDWANRFTKARLLKELRDPSKHLLEAVDQMRERLVGEVAAPSMPRRRVRRGQEFGEELDGDRFLTRSLCPWDRNVREHQARRTVTIGCNLAVSASATAEQLLYRGAAALALADILTSRGLNVGIVLFDSRKSPTRMVGHAVIRHVVKDPMMPLDLSAVALAMCEIAYFRLVMAVGGMRHFPGAMDESLGHVANLPFADSSDLDYLIEANVLSEQAAAQWLTTQMAGAESEVAHV